MSEIERHELADGYVIPRVVVGLWQLSEGHRPGGVDVAATIGQLERFVAAGLNTFDCADIYTGVEEILGGLIRRVGADRVQVHTKLVPDREALPTVDRAYVRRIVERSLGRLGTNTIDLVQLAWWDYSVPGYVEALGWLAELRDEGKVRLVGTTNFDVARLREMASTGVALPSHQVQYSLLDRRPDNGLVDHCAATGSSLLCYGTLAGGFLSERWLGTLDPTPPPWPNRSLERYRLIIEDNGGWPGIQELLTLLHEIATSHGVGIANVATRLVLDRRRVAAAIVGARDARRLPATLRTLELALSDADRRRVAAVLARFPGPAGDVFGLERQPDGPHARIMRYDLNRPT